MEKFKYGRAICYSGYREGQSPQKGIYPSYDEIKEDLLILEGKWDYIRMYDPSQHAKTTLQVIQDLNLNLKVMLGADLLGEESNPHCAWGGEYTDEEVAANIKHNQQQMLDLIDLANQYPEIIMAVSAGNEATPEWNENLVRPHKVLEYVKQLKAGVKQPVTYCENCFYWPTILQEVGAEVDFISIHSYAAWAGYTIDSAFETTLKDFNNVQNAFPDKYCILTEVGWPTNSNGRGIEPKNAGEPFQKRYFQEINKWSEETDTLVYFFEAFDEPWKGSNDPLEPEKHWGVYYVDRTPKEVLKG